MKTRQRTYKDIPLGLTVSGPDGWIKAQKVRTLVMANIGVTISTVGIFNDGWILEVSNIHRKAVREMALNFARGVLATLES